VPDRQDLRIALRGGAWALLALGLLFGGLQLFGTSDAEESQTALERLRGESQRTNAEIRWDLGEIGASDGGGGIDHERPPAPETLNTAQAQRIYDATAEPGDFVTPPNVSIPH
jgi:hypothetical protein